MKVNKIFIIIGITHLALLNTSFSQQYKEGIPLTFNNGYLSLFQKGNAALKSAKEEKILLPYLDNASLSKEADEFALHQGYSSGKFYGKVLNVDIDFKSQSKHVILENGNLWLLKIESPTAYGLQFYFDRFHIPEKSNLYIYNEEKDMHLGAFTSDNNRDDNKFGTQYIKGNTMYIEYFEPFDASFAGSIHINEVVHVYSSIFDSPWGAGGSCHIDVACSLGSDWSKEIRSVGVILARYVKSIDNTYMGHCTGTLLNNTRKDGTPYFLTARHCAHLECSNGSTVAEDVEDWIVIFNHQKKTCNEQIINPGKNPYKNSVFGCRFLAGDATCPEEYDYLLLELRINKDELFKYGVTFAGWDRWALLESNTPYAISIHHPRGDYKKISKDNHPPKTFNTVTANSASPQANNKMWEVSFDQGTVEGGSSGSPLFNSEHRVIGMLRGSRDKIDTNFVQCEHPNHPVIYGKFSLAWNDGGFHYWLGVSQPSNLDTYVPYSADHCLNNIRDGDETGVDCGGADCIPCTSVLNHCYNGIKDENLGETGVDCGWPCRPCGGVAQCTSCKKDGDETDIDCGGSCLPCDAFCLGTDVVLSQFDHTHVSAQRTMEIKNSAVINSGGFIVATAGESISIKQGFHAKPGSYFNARIGSCPCKKMCIPQPPYPNVFTPNGDGINDVLCYIVSGVNRFSVTVKDMRNNRLVYSKSDNVTNNLACVWDGTNHSSGTSYYVSVTFYSDCLNQSHSINNMIVYTFSNTKSAIIEDEILLKSADSNIVDNMLLLEEESEKIQVYPNPSTGLITVSYPAFNHPIISVFDMAGRLKYFSEQVNSEHTEINLSNLPNGIYLIKVIDNKTMHAQKVIINK